MRITALAALLILAALPAQAQIQAGPGLKGADKPDKKKEQGPPPALPGAQTQEGRAIPADRSLAEMSPTDALFDSVDRGNLADAKDAVARGADLSAHNALGLTPLETSVDLGHNDLTFFLLSLRGLDDTSRRAPPRAAAAAAKSPRHAKPARDDVASAADQDTLPARRAPAPTYAATDPGRPAPQAGFLGFGGASR